MERNLHDNDWIGVVINNQDSTFAGRAQVRVFGVMEDIIDEHIPWATPVNSKFYGSNGGGDISIPKVGQFVRIQFNNGDLYSPEILSIQNIDTNLIEQIKEDYAGTHVLLYDPDQNLNIIYQPESGLLIFFNESYLNITPDGMITIQTEDADSLIQMEGDITRIVTKNKIEVAAASKAEVTADEVIVNGSNTTKVGPGPYRSALLAEPIWALLTTMASVIDAAKLPLAPGALTAQVEAAKLAATSRNVKISV